MTIGRLNNAASSVAVPLATSVTSHAASASCERPSSSCRFTPAACRAIIGSISERRPGTTGNTKRRCGRCRCISAAAPSRRGAMYSISERRLPGSNATTVSSSLNASAMRLAARGTSSGIASANGWPTYVAAIPLLA